MRDVTVVISSAVSAIDVTACPQLSRFSKSVRVGRVQGSKPCMGEIFCTRPDRSRGLLYNEYRLFPGDKAAMACC
jgi:hypothetical protein